MFDLEKITRENIKNLVAYSSARDEFSGKAEVFLDANENSLGSPLIKWYNRYPDPHQHAVKEALSKVKGITPDHIFLGNGSDECIDLLYRCFCNPGKDNTIICPPTYGMYQVSANINDVELRIAPLLDDFQLNLAHIETLIDEHTKLIWLCSPNNPTGNSLNRTDIEMALNNFNAIEVSGVIDLTIVQGAEEAVSVSASSDELVAKIKTEVKGGTLKIYIENKGFWNNSTNGKMRTSVTFKTLERLEASGACSVNAQSIKAKEIKIELDGASSFEGNIAVENAILNLSGAASMRISGSATYTKIDASGACNIKGYNLKTDFCKVDASGASNIRIWVSKELKGEASGGSSVFYKGGGIAKDIDTSGGAMIKKKADDD